MRHSVLPGRTSGVLLCLVLVFAAAGAAPSMYQARDSKNAEAPGHAYKDIQARADALYAKGDYSRAAKAYADALKAAPKDKKRWLTFRQADAAWRGRPAAGEPELAYALDTLRRLAQPPSGGARPDRTWAESQESLGDFSLQPGMAFDWAQAWHHDRKALNWWAGSTDLALARKRYLAIAFKCAGPFENGRSGLPNDGAGPPLPLSLADGAVKIATTPAEKAHAEFLLGMALLQANDPETADRTASAFEAALDAPESSSWYAAALYWYGLWSAGDGNFPEEQGADCARAVALFKKLSTDFTNKDTPYWAQARDWLAAHRRNPLSLVVSTVFLPGSQPGFDLWFRRQPVVRFALYRVDLAGAGVRKIPGPADRSDDNWTESLDLKGLKPVRTWKKSFKGPPACNLTVRHFSLDWMPPRGAYILEAKADGAHARELILVTDAALIVKRTAAQAVVFMCGAEHGAPVAGARIRLLDKETGWHAEAAAGAGHVALFHLPASEAGSRLIAVGRAGSRQAFAHVKGVSQPSDNGRQIFYAVTDRPAYRPGDKAHWKVTVRREAGKRLETPAGEKIRYQISDPQGGKVKEGVLTLNDFGSAWASLTLPPQSMLGEYHIDFFKPETGDNESADSLFMGSAVLFRVEEYKLPDFNVTVRTSKSGKPKVFVPSQEIKASIQAGYYSGEPVADARVEVAVYARPFTRPSPSQSEIPWLKKDQDRPGQESFPSRPVQRETIQTDASGHAEYRYQPPGDGVDTQYKIVARVTDASRRMVSGEGYALVSGHPFYADLSTRETVYRAGGSVNVQVRITDAFGRPKVSRGTLTLTRTETREVWRDPKGKTVEGEALKKAKARFKKFPPPPKKKGGPSWSLVRTYPVEVLVATKKVSAGHSGKASERFELPKPGPYTARWTDESGYQGGPGGQTSFLAAGSDVKPLRLKSAGFQLILSRHMVNPGEPVRALVVSPLKRGYVLVGLEGGRLHGFHVVHLAGTTGIIELKAGTGDSPNTWVSADMINKRKHYHAFSAVTVPALSHSLRVVLKPNRETYRPRQAGTWQITTLDASGRPVRAEVSLAVADRAVFAVQKDYAPDPREVFLSWQRGTASVTDTSFAQNYIKLLPESKKGIKGPEVRQVVRGRVVDERGVPIPGALLTATAPNMAGSRGTATDVNGRFNLPLPAGANCQIKVNAEGFNTVIRKGIRVTKDRAITVNFTLSKGATAILVTAAAPQGVPGSVEGGGVPGGVAGGVMGGVIGGVKGKPLKGPENQYNVNYLAPSEVASGVRTAAVVVRHEFSKTAFWKPGVVTNKQGRAVVRLDYPDSLTRWQATAKVETAGNEFGAASASVRTHQDLTVRLECPRFLINGDTSTVSALIQNSGAHPLTVTARLKADGVKPADGALSRSGVHVPAKGWTRVDWKILADRPGKASFQVEALGSNASDAMSRTIRVLPHGLAVTASASGQSSKGDLELHLDLPEARAPGSTSLEIQVSPGPTAAILDALPYLAGYPYGCTEQTMSRFLPSVVAADALRKQGLSPEEAAREVLGAKVKPAPGREPRLAKHDLGKLKDMVNRGLARLYGFHHTDGGWGWWKHDNSDPFMTAYVLGGLCTARESGVHVPAGIILNTQEFLITRLQNTSGNDNLSAWLLYAAARAEVILEAASYKDTTRKGRVESALDALWDRRQDLSPYGQALLVLSAHALGQKSRAKDLARLLEKEAAEETAGGQRLASWSTGGQWLRWWQSPTETTAFVLRALVAADPGSSVVQPAVAWLLAHRTGAHWTSTRDTAMAVLALNAYLSYNHERASFGSVTVRLNGHTVKRLKGSGPAPGGTRFAVDPSLIREGDNEVKVRRHGRSEALYVSALARYYTNEDPVKARSAGLQIQRSYTYLRRVPTLLKGDIFVPAALKDGDSIPAGARVMCTLTLKTDRQADYLMIEDNKPAGLESPLLTSGGDLDAVRLDHTSQSVSVYQELKDTKTAFFITHLPSGTWTIQYELYAQQPGRYHAMPALAEEMYRPHIRANSGEMRMTVRPRSGPAKSGRQEVKR